MSAETSQAQERTARLLVVDDEESIVLTISEVLRLEGYEVDVAMSGAEAVWKLRREGFDLILTDLHMEEGDGLSVLEEARRRAPLTITIVLTGYANVETAISALRHGAYDYLLKPCNIEEMKLTVQRGLDHRRLMLAEREARANLEKLNRELERRVEQRTAELVRVNRELSEANRAKDVFLATLSHELRTPLTPVLGWVNLLRAGGGAAAGPAMLAQGLDAIERNARLQARLIDDLLDISRIVSGKLRIEWEPVDLCAVVESAVEAVRPEAEARRVAISAEAPDGPLVVHGAPVRLQQVVWNLLANAVKFTPDGGRVRVRARRERDEARVEVEDTGIGIAPEFLPHVFDRFRQADGTTTRQFGGLGLGLAIVHALTELHGGWVRAESEGEGRGSRFTFALPCAGGGAAGEEEAGEEAAASRGLPVLLIEDSSDTLELLQMLFSRKGYDVIGAGSAVEALDRAGERRPGLIISDISMPEVDGYTLLEQLRRLPGLERVPAIALTGHAMDEDRERALAAGFSVHVPKPVDPEELFRIVRSLTK
ncbi:MAG TPA: response regulator [Pyrinomonadaceae bacterium]|nr:response regulator [Pyrinomonadaceae bacterium]